MRRALTHGEVRQHGVTTSKGTSICREQAYTYNKDVLFGRGWSDEGGGGCIGRNAMEGILCAYTNSFLVNSCLLMLHACNTQPHTTQSTPSTQCLYMCKNYCMYYSKPHTIGCCAPMLQHARIDGALWGPLAPPAGVLGVVASWVKCPKMRQLHWQQRHSLLRL